MRKVFKWFFLTTAIACFVSFLCGHTEQLLGVFMGGICYLYNR